MAGSIGAADKQATTALCPACRSGNESVWGQSRGRPIIACAHCGVVYFARESMPALPQDYQDYYEYLKTFSADDFAYELQLRERSNRSLKQDLAALGFERGALLDIGAGPGYLCSYFASQGWRTLAGELSAVAIEHGSRMFQLEYRSLESVGPASMDVIVCQHVLEHIPDLNSFVALLVSKLRPGGLLVVAVPHRESMFYLLVNSVLRLLGKGRRLTSLYYPDHLSGFDQQSLHNAVCRHGLTAVGTRNVSPWNRDYDPFFLRSFVRSRQWQALLRKIVVSLVNNVGNLFGRGDWIRAIYRK